MTYGATGNGSTIDSGAINNAIAAVSGSATASGSGPGLVYIPPGNYLSETVQLQSNVILYLAGGAVILGATGGYDTREYYPGDSPWTSYQDFGHTYFNDSLVVGKNLNNIGIEGPGEITGNGNLSTSVNNESQYALGEADKAVTLVLCTNIILSGGTVTSSGHFGILAQGCTNLYMNDYHIMSSSSRDAFDLIQSSHCYIYNSVIQGSDDAMCLKSDYALGYTQACSDIRVDHCWILSTGNNATQFGSETTGNFTDVMFTNLYLTEAGKAGIGITSNDGSVIDGVTYCGITETNCAAPIFMKLSDRGSAPGDPPAGGIKNISILDVTSTNSWDGGEHYSSTIFGYPSVSGSPSIPIQNVVVDNVLVSNTGGAPISSGTAYAPENPTAENPANGWTPADTSGTYPAFGWWMRHVNGVSFIGSNVFPQFSGTIPGWPTVVPGWTGTNCQAWWNSPDGRPAVKDDNDGQNLLLNGLTAAVNTGGANPSPYDIGYFSVTGYDQTNCTSATTSGSSLRISSSNSTTSSIVFPPTFNPVTGNYSSFQSVTLSCQTPGVTIRYTTDDSTPTETHGTIYTSPIEVSSNLAIRAIAYKSGMSDSAVNTSIYALTSVAPNPSFTPTSGTYPGSQTFNITSLATLTTSGTIRYTTDGSTPSHTNGTVYFNPITLSSGTTIIQAIAYGPGLVDSAVTSATFDILVSAGAPVFNPPGGSYSSGQSVAMTSTSPGVSINYTTNGSTPTETNGTLYTGPLVVNANTTLEAIAFGNGFVDSAVSSTTYTINNSYDYAAINLSATTQGASEVEQSDGTIGNWEALEATGTGQWIQYTIPGLPPGTYDFQMEWKGNTDRGILQETFDGTLLSGSSYEIDGGSATYSRSNTLNQYSSTDTYWITDYGSLTATGTGNHIIEQIVVGSSSNGYLLSAAQFYFIPYTPGISSIANQSIDMNASTGAIPFTISAGSGGSVNSLTLSATSSVPGLIPAGGITFSGTGASQTVTVTPAANVSGTALVTVTVSNGALIADSSFDVTVTPTALQSWRLQYFGTALNSGNAADTADPAGDGLSNLEKFVLNLNPTMPQIASFATAIQGSNFTLTYTRSDVAASLVTVQCQWAANPGGPWSSSGITEQILSDNGTTQTVQDSVPMNGAARLFFQLQITDP